ncbi:MAG TPA: 1-acyl-sn-glycerol-3-phosphate acyltransferase [Candidatus Saccharimonadales bacterium]|nr:1-acyl-sn-glycerol-3-phosphate acyltransferase [Candidatus Saccharimonadales bacterium]
MQMRMPGMDKRPMINGDLSNMAEITEYYTSHGPNAQFQRAFHAVVNKLVAPHVVYEPGVREEIQAHLASESPTILTMTHHSWFDPTDDSAALQREKEVFDPIIGKLVIPARMDYFAMPVIGSIIAIGGAKPMARKKDLARYFAGQGLSEEETTAKLEAKDEEREEVNGMIQGLMVEMAKNGYVYASYIEGTRNRGDQLKLQTVRDGVMNLLETMEPAEREQTKIICLSHDYGGRIMRRFLTPTIHINMVDAPSDPAETNELLHDTLQYGLLRARANRRQGAPVSPLGKGIALAGIAVSAAAARKFNRS